MRERRRIVIGAAERMTAFSCRRRGRQRPEPRQDKAVFIQSFIDRRKPDRTSGWIPRMRSTPSGAPSRHTSRMSLAPRSFSRSTAATAELAGGKNRRNHDHQTLMKIAWRLEEILHATKFPARGKVRYGRRARSNQIQHAVCEGDAGPQDRRKHQFLARRYCGDFIFASGVSMSTSTERQGRA